MPTSIPFFKLQGAGNDFVAIDNRNGAFSHSELIEMTPLLCDRRFGVGADGLLAICASEISDYTMIYRNADGSDAGMCGNGGRCIALLAHYLGYSASHQFDVHGQIYSASVDSSTVNLNFPASPRVIEITDDNHTTIYQVHTGTDHIVVPCQPPQLSDHSWLRQTGKSLRYDTRFAPKGTNVNFLAVHDSGQLHMTTYERGVEDLTLACGTGALASAIIHHHRHHRESESGYFQVHCPGGILGASFNYDTHTNFYHALLLTGPAKIVFSGEITL